MPASALRLVLGDQLDRDAAHLRDVDADRDIIVMAEVADEALRPGYHRARSAMFLAAMRHMRDDLRERGLRVDYVALDDDGPRSLPAALSDAISRHAPQRVVMLRPGRHDLLASLTRVCADADVPLERVADDHFLCSVDGFAGWAEGRKLLRMEDFYRWMRRRHGILLEDGEPVGGLWNFDHDNRAGFGRSGPGEVPTPPALEPTRHQRDVAAMLDARSTDLLGETDLRWPVTPEAAQTWLDAFIDQRLPRFGRFQDAMWTDEAWLWHAHLSAAINLRLLHPREVIDRAVLAYQRGHAPIAAVEGFVRQILGWREYVRGIYWLRGPDQAFDNALGATAPLPPAFWSGTTHMRCMSQVVQQLLRHGYAHHIQRLMVAGLLAQLWGSAPREVHEWFMALYVDSIEWVTMPNVLGMSQYADGGRLGSKPYIASGKYVQRQSNYCDGCRYDPAVDIGDQACPFTTLYWDFLARHRERFADHPRMALQVKNLDRRDAERARAVAERVARLRELAAEGAL